MEHLVPIGQFAALTRLSPKALRLYGENGLLPPARVDPDSGYRYYRLDQVAQARLIRLLRAVDMPLAEIAAFLREPTRGRLEAYGAHLAARQNERERLLRYLRRSLDKEDPMTYEVKVKDSPAQPYVSRASVVAIGALEPFIAGTLDELTRSVEPAGPPFVLYHDAVNDETDGRVEVCVPTAEPRGDGAALPAGPVAYTFVEGDRAEYPEILSAYDAVADWAKAHGHELAGPPREIYLSKPDEPIRWEIAWPIR
jgi:DNA-binding transcriptional MerR regulator